MKNKTTLVYLFGVSIILSILGFLIDTDPRPANISTPIFEVFAMTAILFVFLTLLYFGLRTVVRKAKGLFA